MIDREVMQMALDTVQDARDYLDMVNTQAAEAKSRRLTKTLEALRAALAHGEQEPDRTGMTYYKNNACRAPSANSPDCICWTPMQKPVVWMYQDKSTNEVRFQKQMRAFVDHGATYEVPLYAAPPQRPWKGLTDEEVIALLNSRERDGIKIVRAIEAKLKEKNR